MVDAEITGPVAFMTLFWLVVGGVIPWIIPRSDNRGLIQVMLVMTAISCYVLWLCTWLMQLNPLIGPSLTNATVRIMQDQWE